MMVSLKSLNVFMTHECLLTGFGFALAEWWSFGLCDYFVYTEQSGFGRSGYLRSLKQNRGYAMHSDKTKVCDADSFETLDSMAHTWSGL